MKIQTKLTLVFLLLSLGIIMVTSVFSTITLEEYFHARILNELHTQVRQVEFLIERMTGDDGDRYQQLQQYIHSANLRLTLIDSMGTVVFESDLPQNQLPNLENHLHRPEVQDALKQEFGTSTRHSATLNSEMLYLAKRTTHPVAPDKGFGNVTILRLGVPLTQVNQVMTDIRSKIIITSLIALLIASALSFFISKRIASPANEMMRVAEEIRSGNLERRIVIRSKDELGTLGEMLNSMVDKLNDDINRLKKLERVRSEFLGNVSHELRTPIFAVQGMLETLLHGALEDKEVNRDFVERALHNTRNLNTLLGDLIEISRIESGEMKMSFRYFAVDEFLLQVTTDMEELARQSNVSLVVENQSNSLQVFGDKERLKQVMSNLIANAIKYNTPGGKVSVSAVPQDGKIKITVADTGIGISAEHLPRIFERFYRVDKERSRETGGTGLGLAIVKHIVEAHGGKMEVESKVGEGSHFSFVLKT
jgi:two-component system phosphate regulon sensor histidine kinase PhoR